MHFVANSKVSLVKSLSKLTPIIRSNSKAAPILQGILIEAVEYGVYMAAVSASSTVWTFVPDCEVTRIGRCVVDYARFKDRLTKTGNSPMFELVGDSLVMSSTDDQRLGLSVLNLNSFPIPSRDLPDESYKVPVPTLRRLLDASIEVTRDISPLTPLFLQVAIRGGLVTATTGAMYRELPVDINSSLDTSIPTAYLNTVKAFISNVDDNDSVWVSQVEGQDVVIVTGEDYLKIRALTNPMPDLSQTFTQATILATQEIILDRKQLISILQDAKSSAPSSGVVTTTIDGMGLGELKVTASNELGDWFESAMSCVWTGKSEISLRFRVDSLISFLKTFMADRITLYVGESSNGRPTPIVCSEEDGRGIINQFVVG